MKKIVYVDMDDVICDFTTAHSCVRNQHPDVAFPQGAPGFFLSLLPIPEAIESVNWLREHYNTYILTAPSTRNPHCYSEKRIWVEKHFGYEFTKRLIISPNKGLFLGDFLIDDNATGKGQDQFGGELIQFGTSTFPNWKSVIEYLQTR